MYTCTSTVYRATFPLSVSQLSALIIINVINVNTKKIVGDDLAIVGGLFIDKRRSLVINIINVITGVRRNHFPNRSESFFSPLSGRSLSVYLSGVVFCLQWFKSSSIESRSYSRSTTFSDFEVAIVFDYILISLSTTFNGSNK